MSNAPSVTPVYAQKARIAECQRILALPLRLAEIAPFAKPHANTVSGKLNGAPGQYIKVHEVFTAVSMASENAFSRAEHVHYLDQADNQYKADPALDECRVFPELEQVFRAQKLNAKEVGDAAQVPTFVVNNIVKGLPVARNSVDAVFDVVRAAANLNYEAHIYR